MTTVLLVDDYAPHSVSHARAEAFARQGCRVLRFDYRAVARQVGPEQRDDAIVHRCAEGDADLVVFAKCNDVGAHVVEACNAWATTCLWYMDPLNDNYCSSLVDKIRHCSFTCCSSAVPYREACKTGTRVYLVDAGFDVLRDRPHTLAQDIDVAFIGDLRGERRRFHAAVGFRHLTGLYGEEHARTVSRTRINLGFTLQPGEQSARIYKVLAAGGFLLTTPWPGLHDCFTPDCDLALFTSVEELRAQIARYLTDHDARQRIADQGRRTVQAFTWDRFAQRLLAIAATGEDPGPGQIRRA